MDKRVFQIYTYICLCVFLYIRFGDEGSSANITHTYVMLFKDLKELTNFVLLLAELTNPNILIALVV